MRKNKYGNRKTTMFGIKFDSKKEAHRYAELRQWQLDGKITDLATQVSFNLQGQSGPLTGPSGRKLRYVADFTYTRNGECVVEDVKGMLTDVYKLKKAILASQGVSIVET